MASPLFATTRPLYAPVVRLLGRPGARAIGSPTTAAAAALYLAGLILLDARPTQTRVSRVLSGRCQDALNQLLRTTPLSTRPLVAAPLHLPCKMTASVL